MVAEQRIVNAKVIRLNLSELYQHLNAGSILQQMVDGQLIQPGNMKDAEAYDSKYAKNLSTSLALLSRQSPPTRLLNFCTVLDTSGTSQQTKLALKLRSGKIVSVFLYWIMILSNTDYDKLCSSRKKQFLQKLYPSSLPPTSDLPVSDLQTKFLQTFEVIAEAFDQLPKSLDCLKQFFSQLVLPSAKGSVVPIISSSTYEKAVTSREVLRQQSSLWNCFSPHLLKMMCEECECTPAIAAMEQFILFRNQFITSLICRRKQTLNKKHSSSLHPSHLALHTGPISDLQSLHSSVFDKLDEHTRVIDTIETIRLTVHIDRPRLTLQEYDDITTSVCGYFNIPRAALVYGGCSQDGQVVCWMTSASLLPYLKSVDLGMSSNRLMAEEGILSVAVGELHIRCMRRKVSIVTYVHCQFIGNSM